MSNVLNFIRGKTKLSAPAISLVEVLHRDEGERLKPYDDATGRQLLPGMKLMGKITIGVGRNLTDMGITQAESRTMLQADIARCEREARANFPWFPLLDATRQAVVLSLVFNLGITKFKEFKNTIAAIQAGDYELAAARMLQSLWARQVGERAVRLAESMRTGVLQ
jgi:lysozyme